jgi:hypothetical protein
MEDAAMTSEPHLTEQPQSTIDRILHELDVWDGDLPEDAIREARLHRDAIVPRLIEAIREATRRAAAGDVPEGEAHFVALFLLAEFRAKEALPAIVEAMSLEGRLADDLFGDAITEILPRVLAVLADDRLEVLEDMIRNRALDEFVRSAAMETLRHFVRDGRMTRDEAVERLRAHLREAIANRDAGATESLVVALANYSPREAMDEIREAFALELVDPFMIDLDYIEADLKDERPPEESWYCPPTGIADTIEELRRWQRFADDEPDSDLLIDDEIDDEVDDYVDPDDDWQPPASWTAPDTIRNTLPRVGRNEPCPCGSGKKFKKCCGGR